VTWFQQYYTVAESACTSASACTGQVPIALPPGTYTWWVRGWNRTLSHGPWSGGMPFTIPALGTATLLAPSGTAGGASVEFAWTPVANAHQHSLFVTDHATGLPTIQIWYETAATGCQASGSTCRITPAVTLPPGSYTWWIQAWNPAAGAGPWSSGVVFTRP
jgi:hypothetical protein